MPREHWNDVPGDVAASDGQDLPGGFGVFNPDDNVDATIDEIIDNDVTDTYGQVASASYVHGGTTAGTNYAQGEQTGATVDPRELVEGETAHPGAAVGFTGDEEDKTVPPEANRPEPVRDADVGTGGTQSENYTAQQRENRSVESQGPP